MKLFLQLWSFPLATPAVQGFHLLNGLAQNFGSDSWVSNNVPMTFSLVEHFSFLVFIASCKASTWLELLLFGLITSVRSDDDATQFAGC